MLVRAYTTIIVLDSNLESNESIHHCIHVHIHIEHAITVHGMSPNHAFVFVLRDSDRTILDRIASIGTCMIDAEWN